ncbi:CPBP family intramembrane glutamic endopeptidase [Lactobacillus gasseri]|uniref:CPBP family intramembrane glutamic endopeptidase n=1 Tax=Lactobacillus gasseri TaxID=1596 RepID=UPI001E3BCCD6|nr:CPBP family intramembrane glutamic endopeptidase [Lactobacillus gasseri]
MFNLILQSTIIFKSRKLRVEWSILGSSFIFALSHILNVFSAPPYQMKPDQVVHQVVNAFGIGCFLAVLFLYSGKLWLTMLIHTFADIVALSITSIGMIGETLLDPFTQTFIDLSSWLILAAILFLFNKQTVKHTATILTKNKNI